MLKKLLVVTLLLGLAIPVSATWANAQDPLTASLSVTGQMYYPEPLGWAVTMTATATGGVPPLTYSFEWCNVDTENCTGTYGTWYYDNTYTYVPQGSGNFYARVYVRDVHYTVVSSPAYFTITYLDPLQVWMGANPSLPVQVGTPITWTASSSGGLPPIQYYFGISGPSGTYRDWSTS